ncbi:hypothetical protein ES703_13549 [subsurface metagenome]
MIIRHFDIQTPEAKPPQGKGWEQLWSRYYWMTKCISRQRRTEWAERDRNTRAEGKMTETEFQQDCLLSILADIKSNQVNILELGAGWGRICLALAGVIDYKIIPLIPISYRCLAVEGEPTHYQWAKEHFEIHNVRGIAVNGAVSSKSGTCRFSADASPDSQYGQSMIPLFNRYRIPSPGGLYYILTKKTVKIPMYSLDHLVQTYGFDHVDILQMDVQGAEYKVMLGASESIKKDLIDYFFIGTHHRELNDAIRQSLSPKFDLIIDLYPDSVGTALAFVQ